MIAGYYGFGNWGDELILSGIISQLKLKYPYVSLTVLSASPLTTSRVHNVNALSRWNPWLVFKSIWQNDIFLLGGGGLFQDHTSTLSLFYYLALVGMGLFLQSSVVLYAVGVESISNPLARWLIRFLLGHQRVRVSVRDSRSKEILTSIGISENSIHVTRDPVFLNEIPQASVERFKDENKSVLLIPRFPTTGLFWDRLIEILKAEEWQIKAALFQPSSERSYLEKSVFQDIHLLPDFERPSSPSSLFQEVRKFNFVVSARFHGLVLAALMGRPFMGVGDPYKVEGFCREWGMPFLCWEADLAEIQVAVDRLLTLPPNPHQLDLKKWKDSAETALNFMD